LEASVLFERLKDPAAPMSSPPLALAAGCATASLEARHAACARLTDQGFQVVSVHLESDAQARPDVLARLLRGEMRDRHAVLSLVAAIQGDERLSALARSGRVAAAVALDAAGATVLAA